MSRSPFNVIVDEGGESADVHNNRLLVDTTVSGVVFIDDNGGSITIDATSLPLPTGAATEVTLATLLTLAGFQARINTLGQKAMASSTPVTMASDQSALPVTSDGLITYVDADQMFCVAVQVNTAASASDNPLVLLRNPIGSGKNLYIYQIQAGTSVTNVAMIYKVFVAPTITTVGTVASIVQRDVASGVPSVMLAYSLPTISANGTSTAALTQGQNSNALIFTDSFSLKLQPGNDLLVTGRPSSNNRESLITVVWREV